MKKVSRISLHVLSAFLPVVAFVCIGNETTDTSVPELASHNLADEHIIKGSGGWNPKKMQTCMVNE